jgi:pimeloyl-ACP methyl ester carboxylesterase
LRKAHLDRTCLSYRTFPGDRGCLLLLHGFLTSHHYFSGPLGGRLEPFRLVIPDLLGFGDSAKPNVSYTLEDHMACLSDLVQSEGWPAPLFLGGHSLGCLIATALAASLPKGQVAGLVFLNYPRFTSSGHVHATLRSGSSEYKRATEDVQAGGDQALIEASGDMVQQFAALLPPALQEEAQRTSPVAMTGTTRHCLFAYRPDVDLDKLANVPMLHVHGALDRVAPAGHIWERAPDFTKARWVLLKDAGHHLVHTHTEAVTKEILSFLKEVSSM